MSRHTLGALILLTVGTSAVFNQQRADPGFVPLTDKRYTYPNLPYQVDPEPNFNPNDPTDRGPQSGFNLCNSTTENQTSKCQTSFLNGIDDFCLWGPPTAGTLIQDIEGETVAWCSKPGHGTRVMPPGTLTGVQILKTSAYVLVVGTINQVNIGMTSDDDGGELDPNGADLRGNPIGSLVFSNAFPSNKGNNASFQQVIQWHNFMGSNQFCFKICDPSVAGSATYCQNRLDRIGCAYNSPASYTEGEFSVCDSDLQDPPGIYTTGGTTTSYSQPPESAGPITSLPWTPVIPQSRNCVTYTSSALYAAAATITGPSQSPSGSGSTSSPTTSGASSTGSAKPTTTSKPSGSSSTSASRSASSASASASNAAVALAPGAAGGGAVLAGAIGMSVIAGLVGIIAVL